MTELQDDRSVPAGKTRQFDERREGHPLRLLFRIPSGRTLGNKWQYGAFKVREHGMKTIQACSEIRSLRTQTLDGPPSFPACRLSTSLRSPAEPPTRQGFSLLP